MSRYRMLAIDLDGTLLSPGGEVTPRVRAAIHRALKARLLVCFATGRSWTESRMVIDAVEHYDTAVFAGGAIIVDTRNEVILHHTRMDAQLARELATYLEGAGHTVLALQDKSEGVDYLVTEGMAIQEGMHRWMKQQGAAIGYVPALPQHGHEHTLRMTFLASPDEVQRALKGMQERFAERIIYNLLPIPTQGVELVEITDPAANKWEGVLHVARRHGIAPEEIVAIGDDHNDIPMIRGAGLGVAMGNAREAVREIADRIIGSNREEGLAAFIEELVEAHLLKPEKGDIPH